MSGAPQARSATGVRTVPPTVALIGAAGHGEQHLKRLVGLAGAGRVRLIGVCDVRPVPVPDGVPLYTDHRRLLADRAPQAVVICTPPHTHLPIALDALSAGCDLLLEKPPVLTLAEHSALSAALAASGRACQVGFQALGSPALTRLVEAIAAGRLGTVTSVAGVGAWWRPDAYFSRAPWSARRVLDGRPVLDGAIANPFAHALMDCLVIAAAAGAGRPEVLAVERYRVLDLEVEDTACLRLRLAGGFDVTLAVSLRSATFIPGDITVTGTCGSAVLEYPTDRLRLPGQAAMEAVPGRVDLLENLLAHRAAREEGGAPVPLLAPLPVTAPFTAVVDALAGGPAAQRIPGRYLVPHAAATAAGRGPDGPATDGSTNGGPANGGPGTDGLAIDGIAELVRRAGDERAQFTELGVPWATGAWRSKVSTVEEHDAQAQPG
ncbi:Gfo/Idh/MocA family oxidoreductase [Rugosimonospora acidiphila]|uniref:Gfo/Idh/MocA family oxidoreductase n=1 Tax=Rugosimonospora acidiphila TaxID=556531 RepID=A0ABP9RWK8_9ACTN